MHKRVNVYKLVRCGGQEKGRKKGRFFGRARLFPLKNIFICLLSFELGCFSMHALLPGIQAHVQAAGFVSEGDAAAGGTQTQFPSVGDTFDEQTVTKVNEMIAAELEREYASKEPVVKERCDILVAVDPGHGGEDEGCCREKVPEKDINLQIAKDVETRLTELGYQVLLTRDGDSEISLEDRAALANEKRADIYVSIHQNACEEQSSGTAGIETWYNEAKSDTGSRRLAQLIHSDLLLYSGANDRGMVADDSLYVIRETNMPACLVETGFLSNRDEREQLVTEEYQDRLAEAIVSGIDLYFFPKTMYLTFDDGPTEENTARVLDILKEHNIKATFFLIGESVEKHPEMAKRIAEEGHTIGIHCNNHDYDALYQSVDSYVEDFEKARSVIYDTTGVEVKLFRFPGGSINSYNQKVYQEIIDEMTERGYIYFDWNASLEDATKHNEPERLLKNAKESTFGRRKVIMLAHDTVDNTALCLEELIGQFPEYQMLPLTEDVAPVQF